MTRDRTISLKLSANEFQLVDYAATVGRARGAAAWIRDQALAAAKASLGERVASSILEGRATVELMKASIAEARRKQR